VSFLHSEDSESTSGAGKFLVLALVALMVIGGALWFLNRSPEPAPEPEVVEAPPPVVEEEPPPPPPATARRPDLPTSGSLVVTANVDAASVYIDDELVGSAPFENGEIHIGMYNVRVTKEGYLDFVEEVRVRPGREATIRASLDLRPPSLNVQSDIPGATVFLDRQFKGTTPVTIEGVTAGEHQLTVSTDGYEMYAEKVTFTVGEHNVRIDFRQAVADFNESIPVLHKHSFGKCEGVLTADANGIRYVTDHKDSFAIPYGSLERFEVDYIKKNMNLKVNKGRNYNFTEQSGDADALFLFHKNVQSFLEKSS
jgi:hypothetical protein